MSLMTIVPRVVVLLTATVNPGSTAMVRRRDTRQRFNDYKAALRNCWLASAQVTDLVFCENSGWDLGDLRELCSEKLRSGKRIEFLSFNGNQHAPQLGKGAGELEIIKHALQHSEVLSEGDPFVVKTTGRLTIGNIGLLLQMITRNPRFDVAGDFRGNLQWIDSRIFVARASFLRDYLLPLQGLADDSSGVTFEILLGRAVHRALADGRTWVPMMCTPDIAGIAGTSGTPYPTSVVRWWLRDVFRRFKNWAVAR